MKECWRIEARAYRRIASYAKRIMRTAQRRLDRAEDDKMAAFYSGQLEAIALIIREADGNHSAMFMDNSKAPSSTGQDITFSR